MTKNELYELAAQIEALHQLTHRAAHEFSDRGGDTELLAAALSLRMARGAILDAIARIA